MKTGISCGEAMTTKPITIDINSNLLKAAEIMKKRHVGSLIVTNKTEIKGIVTEQDMVRKGIFLNKKPKDIAIKEILSDKIHFLTPEKDIFDALIFMREKNIRHIPIIKKEKLLGFITGKDILKIEPQLFELLVEKIELKEQHRKPLGISEGNCEICDGFSEKLLYVQGKAICNNCYDKIE